MTDGGTMRADILLMMSLAGADAAGLLGGLMQGFATLVMAGWLYFGLLALPRYLPAEPTRSNVLFPSPNPTWNNVAEATLAPKGRSRRREAMAGFQSLSDCDERRHGWRQDGAGNMRRAVSFDHAALSGLPPRLPFSRAACALAEEDDRPPASPMRRAIQERFTITPCMSAGT
jgi:hypothetical protein